MSGHIDHDAPVALTISVSAGSMRALELLARRAEQATAEWIEQALSDCVAAGMDALPDGRVRDQGEGYGLGV